MNTKKEIKMQKEIIDLLSKREKVYHDKELNFYGGGYLMRLLISPYINPSLFNEVTISFPDKDEYKVVTTIEQMESIKLGRKKINLLKLKTEDSEAVVNSALLDFFDKSAQYQITDRLSPIKIYEGGVFVGVVMPFQTR